MGIKATWEEVSQERDLGQLTISLHAKVRSGLSTVVKGEALKGFNSVTMCLDPHFMDEAGATWEMSWRGEAWGRRPGRRQCL